MSWKHLLVRGVKYALKSFVLYAIFSLHIPELRFFSEIYEKRGRYPYAVSVHEASSPAL